MTRIRRIKKPVFVIHFLKPCACILFFLPCFQQNVSAQKINATVDRTRIFIGEQIIMKLSLEQGHIGLPWFQLPDSLNHLEVVNRNKIDTVTQGVYTNFYQTIAITSFDSGQWQFPALAIAGINQITMPINIDVVPVDVSKKKDYNEIKDIEEVQLKTSRLIIFVLAALTLFALFMLIVLVQKKKMGAIIKPILRSNETPLQWALKQLNLLSQPKENAMADTKNYYTNLNNISRSFFAMQFNESNQQLTTDEWMVRLQKMELDTNYKTPFFQLLRMADSVRFAKYLPPAAENAAAINTVANMLEKASFLHSSVYSTYQPPQN